jgi:tyrosine-protein phosphatase YwqE
MPRAARFTDLHSHLVPAVDDGSTSADESRASLRRLWDEGVGTVVTTPHLLLPHLAGTAAIERELERHRAAFERLLEDLDGAPDLPALGLGQEIWAPDAALLRAVAGRSDVGLAGSRWLLVEFGFDLQGSHEGVVREAIAAGRGIVIAHPERYRYLPGSEPLTQMRRWRDLGAVLQVNAGSFTGHYRPSSPDSERLAWAMVREGLVDLVATDHHGVRRAGTSPREAFEALAARGEQELAERALARAPGELLRETVVAGDPPRVRAPGEAA